MSALQHENASETIHTLTQRSLTLYETRLAPLLEPAQNGRVAAIHPDTEDFAVAGSAAAARRTLRLRQPHGFILTRTIGPETRLGLMRRILTSSPDPAVQQ